MSLPFLKIARELLKSLEDYSSVLSHIIFLLEEEENAFPADALQHTEARISAHLEATKEGIYGLHGLSDLLSAKRPFIKWVPEVKETLEMTWETGITPWSFWLKYTDLTPQVKELIKIIKDKWSKDELEKHPSPGLGTNVIICSRKRTYRGIVTSVSPKFLVTNVDDGKEREEDIDACYQLTHDFCGVQANVIHCTVARVGVENVDTWKTEYSQDFVSFLQYSQLTVKIVDKIMKVIPTFVIDLIAYNEEEESNINIRDWVLEVCQGSLESEGLSKQTLTSDLTFPATSLNKPAKSSIIPPFENLIPERLSSNENKEVPTNRLLKAAESMNSSILSHQKDTRIPKVPFKFESVIDAPEFSPINGLKGESSCHLDQGASATLLNGPVDNKISEASNILLKTAVAENSKTKAVLDSKPKAQFKFESVLDAPEFSPVNGLVKTGKWTNDEEEIYSDTFTSVTLPDIGQELKVKVTHVSSSNSFYIHLPDAYSVPDGQTLDDLIKDLNNPGNQTQMMLLNTLPSLGEFLIAFSEKKNKWLRGNVCDVDDDIVQVFFVDYGITEDVSLDKCRKMLGQFNHLPSQAIYCNLSKAFIDTTNTDDEKQQVGKDLLEQYILDKLIDIKIIDSLAEENRLEVIAIANNINMNDLIVKKGYCKNHID